MLQVLIRSDKREKIFERDNQRKWVERGGGDDFCGYKRGSHTVRCGMWARIYKGAKGLSEG